MRNIDIRIFLYGFPEDFRVITKTVSFGTQIPDINPMIHCGKHWSITDIQWDDTFDRYDFSFTYYLGNIFEAVGIEAISETSNLVSLSLTGYLFICRTFQRKYRNIFALYTPKIDLCSCIACIRQNESRSFYIFKDAIFHKQAIGCIFFNLYSYGYILYFHAYDSQSTFISQDRTFTLSFKITVEQHNGPSRG